MSSSIEVKKQHIDLDDNVKLIYQEPEVFHKYHSVYHGQKYGHYYFRSSPATLLEKAKYLDSGYFIYKDDKIVGGVYIKPNFMTDLFVVPPFDDYAHIADKVLKYLISISNSSEKLLLQEIVEEHTAFYKSRNFEIYEDGFWMIRPTEEICCNLPDEYEAKAVTESYKGEIADLIFITYKANPAIKSVDKLENYVEHVERFLKNYKTDTTIYNSSSVIFHKATKEIVGSCLLMEFEGLPLIMSFAVKPNYQGKGIGSYLLKHAISSSSSVYPAIRLYVYINNPAIKTYEHMGFIRNNTLNDMYLINA